MKQSALYLYGFLAEHSREAQPSLEELGHAPAETLEMQGCAALVSDHEGAEVPKFRCNLSTRRTALRQAAGSGAVTRQQRSARAFETPVTTARAGIKGHRSPPPMIHPPHIRQALVLVEKRTV